MTLYWQAIETNTGRVLADFADIATQALQHTLCRYDTSTVAFPVGTPAPPSNWLTATDPSQLGRTMVAIDADTDEPVWAGILSQRQRRVGQTVQLTVGTPEMYTDRRYIRDTLQYNDQPRCLIAADLLNRYIVNGAGGRPGLPLRIVILTPGLLSDGNWQNTDNKTVYSALGDLGCEWTFELERLHHPERIGLVATIGERIGTAATPGRQPLATFDLGQGGNLVDAAIVEDYSNGKGGNDVTATSTGTGTVTPQSDPQLQYGVDMPTVEYRYQAGTNITNRGLLNTYAAQTLALLAAGAKGYTLTASQANAPAYGRTWRIGDDVGFDLDSPEFPEHPTGIGRALGVQFDATTVSPVIAEVDAP